MSRTARLGAFILGTLAILAVGIFIIGGKKFLFTPTYRLNTQFADVAGLEPGASVMVGGLQKGTVRAIDLPSRPGDKLNIEMQMDESTQKLVRKDSFASIQTEGLLGNQYIAVSFGSPNGAEIKDGDSITGVPPLQMSELLDKANGLLAEGQKAMNNITEVSEHIKSVSAKIDAGNGTVGALVNDKSLYNNLDATASSARAAVTTAQGGIADFQDNMEALKHNFLLRGYFKNRGYEDSADLGKDEIESVPQATITKEFTFEAKDLFDKQDSAKLKGQKALNAAGEFLAANEFGVAVIEVSTGSTGSSEDAFTLAQGRALVVRDYIVQHYGFDDTKLKTVALGKQVGDESKANWGRIRVLVYPVGTPIPAAKTPQKAAPAASVAPAK